MAKTYYTKNERLEQSLKNTLETLKIQFETEKWKLNEQPMSREIERRLEEIEFQLSWLRNQINLLK
jgi:hypothetical protein